MREQSVSHASEAHVELLRGVLAREGQNRQLATRVLRQEGGHVQHLAIHHHPAVALALAQQPHAFHCGQPSTQYVKAESGQEQGELT